MVGAEQPVRFGIIATRARFVSWECQAIQALLRVGGTSLAAVIHAEAPVPGRRRAGGGASAFLWNRYLRWFYRPEGLRSDSGCPAAFTQQPPPLRYSARCVSEARVEIDDAAAAALGTLGLDFLLDFTGVSPGGRLLEAARYGVWGFQLGSSGRGAGYPVGIAESFRHDVVTVAALHQLTASGPGAVLKQGTFRTELHSPAATADRLYQECAQWPADLCRRLRAGIAPAPVAPTSPAEAPGQPAAGTLPFPLFFKRLARHKLRDLYEAFLRADQWNMGVVDRPIQDFLHPDRLRNARVDAPPLPNRHVFYADCFARQEDTGSVVYFERYDYRVRRGTIARLPYPWRPHEEPTDVLSFPFHLSYPFLFGPYCLPEAWITNGIRLYDLRHPVTDPGDGLLLLAVPGVDATLLEHAGRYWLFYARMDRDPMLNLFIAYADTLAGPWQDHPQNPVKTDIRGARPAGPFFREGERLYRPAQDCAVDYGHGLTLNEVLTLTPTEYVERAVAHLTSPHPEYPDGLHTIAALDEHRTLIDFKRRRFIPFATLSAFWRPVSALVFGKQGRRKPPVVAEPAAHSPKQGA